MSFVHLHTHSQYSLLDGTATPVKLATRAAELEMPALALTDCSNLYGGVQFYKACKAAGIRPVLGAQLHVQPEGTDHSDPYREEGGYQLVVLVRDHQGYQNLCQLITDSIFHGMDYKPRIDLDSLRRHRDGLFVLSGGYKGVIGRTVRGAGALEAHERVTRLAEALRPDQLFLELVDQGLPGQPEANQVARVLAQELGLSTVVTNAVHYLSRKDAPVHEVLNAIGSGCSLSDPTRLIAPTDQAWLKTEAEMQEVFPDDAEAIERTLQIAEACDYHYDFKTYHFPATTPPDTGASREEQPDTDANWEYFYRAFPPPRDYGLPDPEIEVPARPEGAGNIDGYFRWYCVRGLELRLERLPAEKHPAYFERLEHEVAIVKRMGFPAYLLIVAEFINWSKDNDIPVGPGRGSAAGSVATWAMRITDIDPLRFGLLFERFLNPERVSMPDIDVDFCQDRREEAIEHVRIKYGAELVSQIITYGTLKAKAAVRDVSRVLGLSFPEADRTAKLIPDQLGITLKEALAQEERLRALREGDPKIRRVIDTAMAIEGAVRQTGVHAAGVVIADRPLVEYAPLYRDEPEGGPVVQYDMKSAESIGLIKFDFLGLKTLDQIRDTCAFIEQNYGTKTDMSEIPWDDRKTYALLEEGDALGVFQLESSGMRELLKRLKPNSMDDMVALVALYRPGPLQSGMTDDFVERKHGRKKVTYPLPSLKPLLESTYGTIIYQEQVMQIAQVMAGYSLGEADLLRRAMGKKKAEAMAEQRARFLSGSKANKIDPRVAESIFDLMAKFAAYGFNKSHSAAYGYISYQTAWLKAHYRPEYMAALMTIEAGNTDKVLMYIQDCRRAGIVVRPVCLNRSAPHFSVPRPEDRPIVDGERVDVIHFGLAAVKNVGSAAVEACIEARQAAGGSFESAFQFFEKVDYKRVNRRVVENLIKAGAFDFAELDRAALFAGLEAAMTLGSRQQEDKRAGQTSLFTMMAPTARPVDFRFPEKKWTISEKLSHERDVLGLYLSGHPMQTHTRDVRRYATCAIADAHELRDDEVRLLGLPVDVRTVRTRRGDKMAFVQVEDAEAVVECVFFSDAWTRSQKAIQSGEPILVSGRLESDADLLKMRANTAEPLSEIRARSTREVQFHLSVDELDGDRLNQFRDLLRERRGGCATRMFLRYPNRVAVLALPDLPVEPSAAMEEHVHAMFGRFDVVALQ
jgi:DNA polymerase-3 subunit alpha